VIYNVHIEPFRLMRKRSLDQRLRIHLVYDQSVSSLPSHKEHLVKVCMGDSLTWHRDTWGTLSRF